MVPPHHFVGFDNKLGLFFLAVLRWFVHDHELSIFVLLQHATLRGGREAAVFALEVGFKRPVGEEVVQFEFNCTRFVDGRLDHYHVIHLRYA